GAVYRDTDGAASGLVPVEEASHDVLGLACRPAVLERHVYHLVAIEVAAVPASMLADECAIGIGFRQSGIVGERQAEGGDVARERIVGRDGGFHHLRARRMHTLV